MVFDHFFSGLEVTLSRNLHPSYTDRKIHGKFEGDKNAKLQIFIDIFSCLFLLNQIKMIQITKSLLILTRKLTQH